MTSVHRNPPPKFPSDLLLGIGIALAVVGIFSTLRHVLDQQRYESAMQAYGRADCLTAIKEFNQVINTTRLVDAGDYVPRAQEKKAECEYFQKAINQQNNGKFEAALLDYARLARTYDDSVLLNSARQQIHKLFQKAQVTSLATPKVCDRLEILVEKNLIPELNVGTPKFYLACGKAYEAGKKYKRAIALYEQFLQQNSDPTSTQEMERALARATVADIKSQGARKLEAPSRIATTEDGSTVVSIQNTSPRRMRITFSGPTPKFEELEPCQDCVIYIHQGPKLCPGKGSEGRYVLEPGQYDIAVNFTANPDEIIESWVANWSLETGAEYKSCHIIVRDMIKDSEKQKSPESILRTNFEQILRLKP